MREHQPALPGLDPPAAVYVPAGRRWADIRPGDHVDWPPGGPWTVRRITRHPLARWCLLVDLAADDGRKRGVFVDRHAVEPEPQEAM